MRFGPAAAACILLSTALILPACGEEQTATAGGEKATRSDGTTASDPGSVATPANSPAPSSARRCGRQLGGFLDSLESLNNTLAVGSSYRDYIDAVNAVRATYADVQADRLPLPCLALVAAPAEAALNIYIDAANTWGNCLATVSCSPGSVEPELQREWAKASDRLARAQRGLTAS
jgi:hypothetical protein